MCPHPCGCFLQELRTVTAVAQLYIHSSLNTDRMLSLDILLDKSGFGADLMGDRLIGLSPPPPPSPASPTAVNSATTGTAVPTVRMRPCWFACVDVWSLCVLLRCTVDLSVLQAVPSTRPAPPAPRTLGRKIASPCLGPVVTLSDTKQSLVIHVQEDITIIAWAGHHSPRKYDVNSGKPGLVSMISSAFLRACCRAPPFGR